MNNWEHVECTKHHGTYVCDSNTGRTVCDLYFINLYYESNNSVSEKYFDHPDAEEHAKLITAAPRMLAALKALDDAWTGEFPGGPDGRQEIAKIHDLWREIRTAIKAAELGK